MLGQTNVEVNARTRGRRRKNSGYLIHMILVCRLKALLESDRFHTFEEI
jgi:hypothetical protein